MNERELYFSEGSLVKMLILQSYCNKETKRKLLIWILTQITNVEMGSAVKKSDAEDWGKGILTNLVNCSWLNTWHQYDVLLPILNPVYWKF